MQLLLLLCSAAAVTAGSSRAARLNQLHQKLASALHPASNLNTEYTLAGMLTQQCCIAEAITDVAAKGPGLRHMRTSCMLRTKHSVD
jgi:hypothetical protein